MATGNECVLGSQLDSRLMSVYWDRPLMCVHGIDLQSVVDAFCVNSLALLC